MEKYVKLKDVNDLLMKMYREPRYQHEDEDYYSGVAQVAGMLVGIETIELEEPKEGKWISKYWRTEDDWSGFNHRSIECSVCKIEIYNGEPTDYCPHCGADMRLEETV